MSEKGVGHRRGHLAHEESIAVYMFCLAGKLAALERSFLRLCSWAVKLACRQSAPGSSNCRLWPLPRLWGFQLKECTPDFDGPKGEKDR